MKETIEKNEILRKTELERRKKIYKALGEYILTLKNSLDVSDYKENIKIKKEIKKMAKLQKYFYNPELKKIEK